MIGNIGIFATKSIDSAVGSRQSLGRHKEVGRSVRVSQVKRTVCAFAEALEAANAPPAAAALATLASFLDRFADKQMSALAQCKSKISHSSAVATSVNVDLPTVAEVALHLDCLAKVVASTGTNAALKKDLAVLSSLLRLTGESATLATALEKLRSAMEPQPVEEQIAGFIERLKKEMGTPTFENTFAELAASPLNREQVLTIAMSVYGGIKRSTSRRGALEYIRKSHDAHMSAKRGIEATGGRSAA
jgi:hypothetical protein